MKHLKKYKKVDSEPKFGDYVLFKLNFDNDRQINPFMSKVKEFIDNNIGKILKITGNSCEVQYENLPYDLRAIAKDNSTDTIYINKGQHDILGFSKRKKDLEPLIVANKYNI